MEKKVIIKTEEELEYVAQQGYHILRKVVEHTTKWRKEYGAINKNNMELWLGKAIEFLKEPTKQTNYTNSPINVEIEKGNRNKKIKPIG